MNIYEHSGMTSIQCIGHITDVTSIVIGMPPLCFHNVGLNQQLDLFILHYFVHTKVSTMKNLILRTLLNLASFASSTLR